MSTSLPPQDSPSRRQFLKTTAAAGAAVAGGLSVARSAHAAGGDVIRLALVGCGGRGTGAAVNALSNAAKANVKLVAMADAFRDRLDQSLSAIQKQCKDRVDVSDERKFTGLDCHRQVLDAGVDVVLLCSPPGFRPYHFEAAVAAGKHVFLEKPLATDAPGLRRIMAANVQAKGKGLMVAVGHHLRHEDCYRRPIQMVHDGALGKLHYLRAYFNTGSLWKRPRMPDQTEFQYQVRNWYYFTWLSGDHIVEQHVHDLDVCNWIAQGHPVEANGMGGRQVRKGKDFGEIFDHHAVEYTYANGLKLFSFCRQIDNCWGAFAEYAHGDKGHLDLNGGGSAAMCINGKKPQRWTQPIDGHQAEMDDLFAAMLAGKPYNEADWAAESTMTAILGRMATYSGKAIDWETAINSKLSLAPKTFAWDAETPITPDKDGLYACAEPGTTKAW
jgi:myo-inositol 2-dehydrogenase / D-chiro-inositol 1-dehydrogenase